MSEASGSKTAPSTCCGRSTGNSAQVAAASSNCPRGLTDRSTAHCSASKASSPGRATISAPRGASSGCSAKPAGGCARKARLAQVSARTCGVP
jgi:hypothetical protein